ncbi:MAG: AAA family ATPase [Deltaproteobacteria bacterium]|nr:MAG: AAA family ATPase [Deltaproteobacteria bacterium]
MRCGECGTERIPGKSFCHACGARAALRCTACGGAVEAQFRFCPDCGQALAAPPGASGPAADPSHPGSPAPEDRLTRLSRHIPESLARKLRVSGTDAGERKRVTVLFCDLVGSTAIAEALDPEEYRELLERYLEVTFAEIYRFEGIVNQLAGDGLMALFGAPIAHEDAPERAVRAALAARDALAALRRPLETRDVALHARFGIHTGTVVVGAVGNDLKMDYTAVGDTTNLAARLQAAARPDAILISDATARLVAGRFHTREVGPFDVKGKAEPVTAHEVLELAEALTPMAIAQARGLTPLVGRQEELQQLEACYRRLRGGLGQVVSVVGDAGTGKSRLIYEFKERIADTHPTLFEARCSSLTRGAPYAPWVSMLRDYFGLAPNEPDEASLAKLAEGLDGGSDDPIFPYLCAILSLPTPGLEPAPLDVRKRRAFDAVDQLVNRATARGPTVMIVEDLHWIDDASREMLDLAAGRFDAGSMLIVTHRPQYRPTWQSKAALTQLHLQPLSDAEGKAVIRACVGGGLPLQLERRILHKGEGNPFYLEELTRSLVEGGALVPSPGGVRVTRPVDEIRIPETVQELLGARIDRLRPAAKRVAQIAAVVGRQFRREQLEALLSDERLDVGAELAELERLGVIHRKAALAGDEYRFGESLTQEVAYEGLLLRERRRLHERIARLLESAGGTRNLAQAAVIARHYARSDDREAGLRALLEAAAAAEALPSYGDAERLNREAWELAESATAEEASDALRRLTVQAAIGVLRVTLLYGSTDLRHDERVAQHAETLARELGDDHGLAILLSLHGLLLSGGSREQFERGLALTEAGVEVAEKAGLEDAAAALRRGLALEYLMDGRFEAGLRILDDAIAALVRLGQAEPPSDTYMGALWFRARALFYRDDFAGMRREARRIHELATRVHNRTIAGASAGLIGLDHFTRAEYAEAERWGRRALEIGQEIDNVASVRTGGLLVLGARCARGERSATDAEIDALERGLLPGGDQSGNLGLVVEVLLELGELERAERLAEGSAARAGSPVREAGSALALGAVCLKLGPGHWRDAEQHFANASALAERLGMRSTSAHALLGRAELAAARCDAEAARADAGAAHAIFDALGMQRYALRAAEVTAKVCTAPPADA